MIGPIVFFLRVLAVVLKFGALLLLVALFCFLEVAEMAIHDVGEPLFAVLENFIDTMDSHITQNKQKKEIVPA